jgi:glycosyltransferase involved in cell wall biosynthesis
VREAVFAIPGDLATPTGGYRYDRRVIEELGKLGWNVRVLALPGDFPSPSGASLRKTEELLAATSEEAPVFFDGLAFGAIPSEILVRVPRRYVALVHHPLAFETGLPPERVSYFRQSERAALVHAVHIVVTSAATRDLIVSDFGVTIECVTVAEPGTEPAPRARGSKGPPRLLSVGAVSPRKGFRILVEALAAIAELDWDCRIAGSLDRDKDETAALRKSIAKAKLEERVVLLGTLDEDRLQAEYDCATLFVLPSHFEGYGMAFAEALAHGLPIVAARAGAVPDIVSESAGLLVPPGDVAALAASLRRVILDGDLRRRLAAGALAAGAALPDWRQSVRDWAAAFDRLVGAKETG